MTAPEIFRYCDYIVPERQWSGWCGYLTPRVDLPISQSMLSILREEGVRARQGYLGAS